MKIIYVSYDGMTDPLGQSQVLPYLTGLSKKGYNFHLLSCEKYDRFEKNQKIIQKICDANNIVWYPLIYHKNPPILSSVYDVWKLRKCAKEIIEGNKIKIIHCRGHYLTSLAASDLAKRYNAKYIFDMRGFWADERIDGKIWNKDIFIYRFLYSFFKNKERIFLKRADKVITLTRKAKEELLTWGIEELNEKKIEVISCCADLTHFNPSKIKHIEKNELKKELGFKPETQIMIYVGSLGTWYMLDEMLDFYKEMLIISPKIKFLFVTLEDESMIKAKCEEKGIPIDMIKIVASTRERMPTYLSIANWGIAFIKPLFSKKGSSAVKIGEMMAMGIPIICNDIGDNDLIIKSTNVGYLIQDFSKKTYSEIIKKLLKLENKVNKKSIRETAFQYYDLEKGIAIYEDIYKNI